MIVFKGLKKRSRADTSAPSPTPSVAVTVDVNLMGARTGKDPRVLE